jgi:hypothetical protein
MVYFEKNGLMGWRKLSMGRLQLIVTLSLVFTMFVWAVLPRQSRAWQTEDRRSSGDGGGTEVGEMAPTFTLMSLDGKGETDLASFRGKRPVVLFFGSYT